MLIKSVNQVWWACQSCVGPLQTFSCVIVPAVGSEALSQLHVQHEHRSQVFCPRRQLLLPEAGVGSSKATGRKLSKPMEALPNMPAVWARRT
jgi:hypothetical protein